MKVYDMAESAERGHESTNQTPLTLQVVFRYRLGSAVQGFGGVGGKLSGLKCQG